MNTEQNAKEILDYCVNYLLGDMQLKDKKLEKAMLKEIKSMLETD